jgi:hypothetical protein
METHKLRGEEPLWKSPSDVIVHRTFALSSLSEAQITGLSVVRLYGFGCGFEDFYLLQQLSRSQYTQPQLQQQ